MYVIHIRKTYGAVELDMIEVDPEKPHSYAYVKLHATASLHSFLSWPNINDAAISMRVEKTQQHKISNLLLKDFIFSFRNKVISFSIQVST